MREAWRTIRAELATRWGGFCLLTVLVLAGYAAVIFSMAALNVGALPNYFRWFRVLEGFEEILTLAMPLGERYELLAEQPIFEFGYRHPLMGSLEGAYTLTLHVALNLTLVSALVALYLLLMARAVRGAGLSRRALTSLGLGGGASAGGVLTAGAATVACCGAGAASILLTLLGVGAGVGLFLAEHDRAFGGLGLLLMLANLWVAARWARPGGVGR
ncbi:MAG: hypothetical protein HYY64_09320 [Candidatus Rokubacteria bacterium]|nr:hypothetical protein [Candidatus Rokubacteria bacterium]